MRLSLVTNSNNSPQQKNNELHHLVFYFLYSAQLSQQFHQTMLNCQEPHHLDLVCNYEELHFFHLETNKLTLKVMEGYL